MTMYRRPRPERAHGGCVADLVGEGLRLGRVAAHELDGVAVLRRPGPMAAAMLPEPMMLIVVMTWSLVSGSVGFGSAGTRLGSTPKWFIYEQSYWHLVHVSTKA